MDSSIITFIYKIFFNKSMKNGHNHFDNNIYRCFFFLTFFFFIFLFYFILLKKKLHIKIVITLKKKFLFEIFLLLYEKKSHFYLFIIYKTLLNGIAG